MKALKLWVVLSLIIGLVGCKDGGINEVSLESLGLPSATLSATETISQHIAKLQSLDDEQWKTYVDLRQKEETVWDGKSPFEVGKAYSIPADLLIKATEMDENFAKLYYEVMENKSSVKTKNPTPGLTATQIYADASCGGGGNRGIASAWASAYFPYFCIIQVFAVAGEGPGHYDTKVGVGPDVYVDAVIVGGPNDCIAAGGSVSCPEDYKTEICCPYN